MIVILAGKKTPRNRGHEALKPSATATANQWLGRELNPRHADFQSAALPTELPSLEGEEYRPEVAPDLAPVHLA